MAEVRGIKEIGDILKELPGHIEQSVVRSGNRAVAKELASRVQKAPRVHFLVRMAATFQINKERATTKGYKVGLGGYWGPLAHLFEFGTQDRTQKKTGRFTGRMKATPFLRPAVDSMSPDEVAKIWSKAASANLNRQLKRLAKIPHWAGRLPK